MTAAGWALLGAYAVLTVLRLVLAARAWRPPAPAGEPEVTVLQPILSGDPHLADDLAANLATHPSARFRWLVDEADAEGVRVATRLASAHPGRVEVRTFGAAPATSNPKVFKLARAIDPTDDLVALLDDDTVLPPGTLSRACAALADGDLVTGLPYYKEARGGWARLVAGFVNGSALVTYLPLLAAGPPVSVNGMFVLTTRGALERAGGLGAIEGFVCDDYELALAYRRTGQRLVQAALPVWVRTTVPDAASYGRLMRRWMVFTGRLVRDEVGPAMLGLVLLPAVLPALALLTGVLTASWPLVAGVGVALLGKAAAMAALRRRLLGATEDAAAIAAEVVADLLQPVHAAAALASGGRITWRGRPMRLDAEGRVRP